MNDSPLFRLNTACFGLIRGLQFDREPCGKPRQMPELPCRQYKALVLFYRHPCTDNSHDLYRRSVKHHCRLIQRQRLQCLPSIIVRIKMDSFVIVPLFYVSRDPRIPRPPKTLITAPHIIRPPPITVVSTGISSNKIQPSATEKITCI